jgi:hypothetical protein
MTSLERSEVVFVAFVTFVAFVLRPWRVAAVTGSPKRDL